MISCKECGGSQSTIQTSPDGFIVSRCPVCMRRVYDALTQAEKAEVPQEAIDHMRNKQEHTQ